MTLLHDILSGKHDSQLERIYTAIKARREQIRGSESLLKFNKMLNGTKVRFNDNTRPKYLQGATGTIDSKRQKKVTVLLDKAHGKYTQYTPIVCPVLLLDIITEEET